MECPNCDGKTLTGCCGVPFVKTELRCPKCGKLALAQCVTCVVMNDPTKTPEPDSETNEITEDYDNS